MSDEDFKEQFETLNEVLVLLNAKARMLEQTIAANVAERFRGHERSQATRWAYLYTVQATRPWDLVGATAVAEAVCF